MEPLASSDKRAALHAGFHLVAVTLQRMGSEVLLLCALLVPHLTHGFGVSDMDDFRDSLDYVKDSELANGNLDKEIYSGDYGFELSNMDRLGLPENGDMFLKDKRTLVPSYRRQRYRGRQSLKTSLLMALFQYARMNDLLLPKKPQSTRAAPFGKPILSKSMMITRKPLLRPLSASHFMLNVVLPNKSRPLKNRG